MAEEKIEALRLSVRDLSGSNGDTQVLDGLDLSLTPGETLAIIGRSGGGKTTLLRCLCLLQQPSAGSASLDGIQYMKDGQATMPLYQIRQEIVMVFQDYNLFPNMTALRNITFALEKVQGVSKSDAVQRAREMADKLGIAEVLDRYPNSLSGGQAQRLALARAMVLQPKVLLLDEITSGLDPETIINVVDAVTASRKADTTGKLAIVLVTHLMHFASDFADSIAFIHNGKILEQLPAKTFFESCQQPETRSFVSAFQSKLV